MVIYLHEGANCSDLDLIYHEGVFNKCLIESEEVYREYKPKQVPLIGEVSLVPPFDLKNLPCIHLCTPPDDFYPFHKLWRQRVLSKNVKLDPLEAK